MLFRQLEKDQKLLQHPTDLEKHSGVSQQEYYNMHT